MWLRLFVTRHYVQPLTKKYPKPRYNLMRRNSANEPTLNSDFAAATVVVLRGLIAVAGVAAVVDVVAAQRGGRGAVAQEGQAAAEQRQQRRGKEDCALPLDRTTLSQ